ncbi:major facilitator superfamily domain-containing protein [Scleroderma yunnanense]
MSYTHQPQLLSRGSSYRNVVDDIAYSVDDLSNDLEDTNDSHVSNAHISPRVKAHFVRWLALFCACCFSVGNHYTSYILGPLKSRLSRELGTSDIEFSLLISAISLNGTWTPLLGGVMASVLGTTLTSIIATGLIFGGQALVLLGDLQGSVRLMVFGLFVFGLGTSPLAVVQESIIVRFFNSHGLGISMALGLVAGKSVSFVSARTSYPLAARFGRHAPFIASTLLTGLSFIINLIYLSVSKWLIRESGTTLEAREVHNEARRRALYNISEARALEKVAKKRYVHLDDVLGLGDLFWAYIGLNVLCGALWSPFTHLAPNLLERRYELDEAEASKEASYLLVGSMVLYPVCGYLVDRLKRPQATLRLLMLSAVCTMICYAWLSAPPQWTGTPLPGILSYSFGFGFSTLLLVLIVPALVPLKYVSTTLGLHKSIEHTGSTIMQVLTGIWLDKGKSGSKQRDGSTIQYLLLAFLSLNVLEILVLIVLGRLYRNRWRTDGELDGTDDPARSPTLVSSGYTPVDQDEDQTAITGLPLTAEDEPLLASLTPSSDDQVHTPNPTHKQREIRRGRVFACICAFLLCFCWLLFLGTAWSQLRSRDERQIPTS